MNETRLGSTSMPTTRKVHIFSEEGRTRVVDVATNNEIPNLTRADITIEPRNVSAVLHMSDISIDVVASATIQDDIEEQLDKIRILQYKDTNSIRLKILDKDGDVYRFVQTDSKGHTSFDENDQYIAAKIGTVSLTHGPEGVLSVTLQVMSGQLLLVEVDNGTD